MNYAIIFAGGAGTRMRMGNRPKQFLEICGKSVLCYVIDQFEKNEFINGIVVVSNSDFLDYTKTIIDNGHYKKILSVVVGGDKPIDSQYNGLKILKGIAKNNDIILMHDGVRPIINSETINNCIKIAKLRGNAMAVSPAIETIAVLDNQQIVKTINRNQCVLVRAPQCLNYKDLIYYHTKSIKDGIHNFIDTASMLLYYGVALNPVLCPQENIKITTDNDYYTCESILKRHVFERYIT